MQSGVRLVGLWRKGGPVIVDCYCDPNTGKAYEIEVSGGNHYRETPAPKDRWEIVSCGPWQELSKDS